jgi:AraC-like DNA-binding protein
VRGPVALMLADDEIERVGAKSRTFRTDGARVEVVQLRFATADLRVPIGIAHAPLPVPAYVWDAVREVAIDPARLGQLLGALARANVIAPTIDVLPEEPERFRRMWQALHPLYTSYGGTASLKQLANSLNMSMRQVGRDAKEMAATFGFGSGYRDSLLVLRLRVAALLLSAPAATVADVATIVGYGSAIAMARAFRDAKLPPPSAVQAAVRGE